MSGPMYLRDSSGVDVFINAYVPEFFADGERAIVYDGKRGYVSRETFQWMKTATSAELGDMRVMRITSTAAKGWMPPTPKPESFRYVP